MNAQFPEAPSAHPRVFTKPFLIVHGVYLASTIMDVHTSLVGQSKGRCVEGGFDGIPDRVSAKEMYGTELGIWAIGTGFDAIFQYAMNKGSEKDRKIFFFIPYEFASYGTYKHIKGTADWYARCW